MSQSNANINNFSTRVRQLILQYQNVKKENNDLYNMVDERDKTIAELKERIAIKEKEYEALKMAKIMQVTDGDLEATKAKIAKIIRSVNQCITLLSENK